MSQYRITNAPGVPVLTEGGALVVEATLAGCVVAWLLARDGCRTVLATSGCSLPHELVVVRQPWTRVSQWKHLPQPFRDVLHGSVSQTLETGVTVLNLAKLAVGIEDLLLDAGVRLFYGLTPCGVERGRDGTVSSVIFGGKGGLQAIRAGRVIDATTSATIAAFAGATIRRRPLRGGKVTVRIAAKAKQFERPGPLVITRGQISEDRLLLPDQSVLPAPGVPELIGGQVVLHGPYAQMALRLPVDLDDPFWLARLSVASRESLVRIGHSANQQRDRAGRTQLYFHRFSGGLVIDPLVRTSGTKNIWICGPAANVDDRQAKRLTDPFQAVAAARQIADEVLRCQPASTSARRLALTGAKPGTPGRADVHGQLYFADAPSLHATTNIAMPGGLVLPVLHECDVLVVGAGTAGVPAALAAAQASAKTTLIDQHGDVGGVRTIGGVGSYWFGRTTPFQKACDDGYDAVSAHSGMAEEIGMMRSLLDAGVTVLAPCPVVGAIRRDEQIAGVVVITSQGLAVVSGKVVVDATGDADLAAWAGAPFEYGNGRDAWTLWASFANFNHEKRTANRQYESSLEVRDPWDFTRTIVRGRRRPGMWRNLEHEMPQHYVTPRESRRILADATITYSGILAGESFPDVMTVAESNFDIKGLGTSQVGACGVVSDWDVYVKFCAAIPYRAIVPRGLTNVLVAGRAYSASHDAISLARMQRDMVSLGGAAGVAAAWSASSGTRPANLDVASLQQQWLRRGMLLPKDLQRFGVVKAYRRREATADCRALLSGRKGWSQRMARLMRSKASLAPLRRAFRETKNTTAKVRVARMLCYLGDRRGVPFLLKTIESQIEKSLPRLHMRCLAVPPEHGWAPEPVFSLRAIGLAGAGGDAATVMAAMARKIADNAEQFGSRTDSQFDYVHAICAVAERSPGPEMIAPLHLLYQRRCLRNLALPYERDMRFTEDPVLERRAYLELCIGRAFARCADPRGFEILVRYSDDIRGTLARSAADELTELLGEPWPMEPAARRRLLKRHAATPTLQPLKKVID